MTRYDWYVVKISTNEVYKRCATKSEAKLFAKNWGKDYKVVYIDEYRKGLKNENLQAENRAPINS